MQRLTRISSRLQWQAQVVGMDLDCSDPTADLPVEKKRYKKTIPFGVKSSRSQEL